MAAVHGICVLCNRNGCLRISHLIPAWAYKRILRSDSDNERAPVRIAGGSAVLTNKQITQRLLCTECELRFAKYERHLARLTMPVGDRIKFYEKLTRANVPSGRVAYCNDHGDADLIAYFAASLLWRASVMSAACALGAYQQEFQRYLLGEAQFPGNAVLGVGVFEPSTVRGTDTRRWISAPTRVRTPDGWLHGFLLCGLVFRCFVGGVVPNRLRQVSLAAPNQKRSIMLLSPEECPDFLAAAELAAVAKPRGKLAGGEVIVSR